MLFSYLTSPTNAASLKRLGRRVDRQAGRQTDRQTDKQTNRQTDQQTNIQTERQKDRKTERRTDRQTDRQTAFIKLSLPLIRVSHEDIVFATSSSATLMLISSSQHYCTVTPVARSTSMGKKTRAWRLGHLLSHLYAKLLLYFMLRCFGHNEVCDW